MTDALGNPQNAKKKEKKKKKKKGNYAPRKTNKQTKIDKKAGLKYEAK